MAQLASARLSEREVPGSIFSDFNVCFDFPLIRVAIALQRKQTHRLQMATSRDFQARSLQVFLVDWAQRTTYHDCTSNSCCLARRYSSCTL